MFNKNQLIYMNYKKLYISIIKNAFNRPLTKEKGYEIHHILPKSIFPLWKNRKSNLVKLTYKEHFFCHQLLCKIYPSSELNFALMSMSNSKKYGKITMRQYEKLKNEINCLYSKRAERMKEKWKDPEFREKMKKSLIKSRDSRSEKMKEKWKDPEFREKMSESLKASKDVRIEKFKNWAKEHHSELSEKRKNYLKDNKDKALRGLENFKKENPNFYKEYNNRKDVRERKRNAMTNYYADEANRKKLSEILKNSEAVKISAALAHGIKVRCLQTNEIFLSLSAAARWCGITHPNRIADVCRKQRNSAGKHPITKEPLTWEFVGE